MWNKTVIRSTGDILLVVFFFHVKPMAMGLHTIFTQGIVQQIFFEAFSTDEEEKEAGYISCVATTFIILASRRGVYWMAMRLVQRRLRKSNLYYQSCVK
jgi:hypothetical protein